ncbi:MAG: hypothetical protein M3Z04_25450 [Chloroflexota bacterium]|nr:hypothetical protein [Chloroflexota bacterium]
MNIPDEFAPYAAQLAAVAAITPDDLTMYDAAGQAAVAADCSDFYKTLDEHSAVRLLLLARRRPAAHAVSYLQALRAACPATEGYRLSGLGSLITFVRVLVEGGQMKTTDPFLLTWTTPEMPAPIIFANAQQAFGTPVQAVAGLPPIFGDYQAAWDHLEPQEPGQPWASVWGSSRFVGMLDWNVLARLVRLEFPFALALDVETRSPDQAELDSDFAYNALTTHGIKQAKSNSFDAGSRQALADVLRVKQALTYNERLHRISMIVLVFGASRREMRHNGARLRSILRPYIRFRPLWGQQGEGLKFFTPTPRTAIHINLKARPILSSGLGYLTPAGFPSRQQIRGLFYGRDRTTREIVCNDSWTQPPGAGAVAMHKVFLGKTGWGKTFAMLCLLYRMILIYRAKVIVLGPVPHFAKLGTVLGDACSYNRIGAGATLNLLDPIYPDLGDQISHLRRQLMVLLTCGSGGAVPRVFTEDEQGALDEAARRIYAPIWDDISAFTPATLPIRLADLVRELLTIDEGARLGTTLYRLFVVGSQAATFNPAGGTSIDFAMERPATIFDISKLDKDYQPVYMGQFIARLHQEADDPARTVPLIFAVDEYQIVSQNPVLSAELNRLAKLLRYKRGALWTATQFLPDYLLNEDSKQVLANASFVLMSRQENVDQSTYRTIWPTLTPHYLTSLQKLQKGEFLAKMEDTWIPLQIDPSPVELAAFSNT